MSELLTTTRYGFAWGPLVVERVASDPKRFGYLVSLKTRKQTVEVRVTPGGLLRVGDVRKTTPTNGGEDE